MNIRFAGSIPATGRKDPNAAARTVLNAAAAAAASSGVAVPNSAANSLQFNQLIGGAITPSVMSAGAGTGGIMTAGANAAAGQTQTAPLNLGTNTMMIGDYVLNQQQQQLQQQNVAAAAQAQAAAAAAAFRQ